MNTSPPPHKKRAPGARGIAQYSPLIIINKKGIIIINNIIINNIIGKNKTGGGPPPIKTSGALPPWDPL